MENEMEIYKGDRKKYAEAVLDSPSRKKLIIAGPGTGKTYIFKSLFGKIKRVSDEEGLALTFIKNLVADLKAELAGLARVSTFHAYCRSIVHSFKNEGFEYYPNTLKLIEKDINILGFGNSEDIERCFYGLKNGDLIDSALKIGDYYNASGHSDSVCRVTKYFNSYPNRIPTYPLIVVDEYQDFNYLETSLVETLSRKSPLLIVGDDDQALYAFKQASPDYIRRLIQDPEYQRFELPYCSRCTKVIVDAVKKTVCIAKQIGRLEERLNKPFKYFPPDKRGDSERHPHIINVNCTVERKDCHYMGKYIATEISKIPLFYVRESKRRHEPTALIIGPRQFLDGVKVELKRTFGYMADEKQGGDGIDILDGYKSILKNPISRLGWRILLYCDSCDNSDNIIQKAILEEKDIYDFISSRKYASKHQKICGILNKITCGDEISIAERKLIEVVLGISPEEVKTKLINVREEEPKLQEQNEDKDAERPDILCTSFEGSKGLAAQYVFIVGVNEKHFPQKTPPSNRDIYRLIVALTRTRKRCYMISCNIFGGEVLKPSIYKLWLKDHLSKEVFVDKKFINQFCN